jgi:hypothetical protein
MRIPVVLLARVRAREFRAIPAVVRVAIAAGVATLAATAVGAGSASAAPSFDGIVVKASLIAVNTATSSATMRIEPEPSGSYTEGKTGLLTKNVVLYTSTVSGELAHSYRAGTFMDPFESTVPVEGDTSTYPFFHLRTGVGLLASTGGDLRSGNGIRVHLQFSSAVAGYRVSPNPAVREGPPDESVQLVVHVDPSWATVLFAVFIMFVMWALALGAVSVAVNLVIRRRKFEGSFATLLAALLFAFPTVRNNLPGIPPVGVLFDYAAFFWAEALVALSLIALLTGWTLRALVGTTERRD